LLAAALVILYSLLFMLATSTVWIVTASALFETWFYPTQASQYPAELYERSLGGRILSFGLTFVVPILLAVNVPARYAARLVIDWHQIAWLLLAALRFFWLSRRFFQFALRYYRSASS
jgi:ABC-2 type transport system permease protein